MADPRTPGRGIRALLLRLSLVVLVLAAGTAGVWVVDRFAVPGSATAGSTELGLPVEPAPVEPGSAAPADDRIADVEPSTDPADERSGSADRETDRAATDGEGSSGSGARTLADWAAGLADVVGVPERALVAYGNAELVLREHRPDCGVSWATLAGIGRVESDHGRYGGAVLGDDGRPSEPIIGISLDGSDGVRAIPDTDGGRLDGDTRHDRAVGPMQFIPQTWERFGADASGDGVADPQQIDDAALSAARYLCAGDRAMSDAEGWWDGVLSYNNSTEYGRSVFSLADGYAKRARGAAG